TTRRRNRKTSSVLRRLPQARRQTFRPQLEILEDRCLLATIAWDGGPIGTGTDWNNAANWVGDVLPGSGDDAVIPDLSGTPTITSTGTVSIHSLISNESLAITGGTFTLAATSQINAGLNLSGGVL